MNPRKVKTLAQALKHCPESVGPVELINGIPCRRVTPGRPFGTEKPQERISLAEYRDSPKQRKHQKYSNKVTETPDGRFDSEAEYRHWCHLKIRLRLGEIADLQRQVSFELAPAVIIHGRKRPPLRYVADMTYLEAGKTVVADVKGAVTDAFRIKRHLMMSVHGIEIQEIRA